MVSDVIHLDTTISQRIKHEEDEKDDEDTISVSTASTDNCDGGAVVLQDAEDKAPCFQNIEVTNSSDVHFGNKTYYQGPVTIKQILYTNRDGDKSIETNGEHPQLAINDKCSEVNGVSYGNYNDGYTTDSSHHISNGHTKLPNGIHHDHYESFRGSGEKKISKTQGLLIGSGILIVVLLIVTGVTLALTLQGSNSMNSAIIDDPDDIPDSEYEPVLSPGLHLISREDWLAIPPRRPIPELQTPAKYVIIHSKSSRCRKLAICKNRLVSIQKIQMFSSNYSDICYNFAVGGDGYSYEGRGWKRVGQCAPGYDDKSIQILLIGTFNTEKPTESQLRETRELIKNGTLEGYISKDFKLMGMSQINLNDSSPGKMVMEEIKTWPNFSDKLK